MDLVEQEGCSLKIIPSNLGKWFRVHKKSLSALYYPGIQVRVKVSCGRNRKNTLLKVELFQCLSRFPSCPCPYIRVIKTLL